ncbi:uncharacterized protein LOC116192285 isoform X2 [Punica granatum]|uniref:Uncharacterized protein LOC116192285 isoform X2 n=1 Tax=Punica granatum TaxID=22663 RepID=A0A6P8C5Q8_PUNGR|nr:uncharacterized protein LOC116192285 isoform X2 [Punica granatum]
MDPSPLVAEVFRLTVEPACRQLGYMLRSKTHVNELKGGVGKLVNARERVQHAVNEAILKGEWIEGDVQSWLNKTDELTESARKVIADVESKKSCLHFIPNPVACHQLGRKARNVADDIQEHCGKGEKFNQISYHDAQTTEAAATLPSSSSGTSAQPPVLLDSRALIMSKIMEALTDNNVRRIGVHGMGGVGKTTLLDEVERKAKASKRFDKVIRKLISKNPNVGVIRAEINHILGQLDKKDNGGGSGKKKAFIILDDLWEEHHLTRIEIEDNSYQNVEVKLLLTSRNEDLLADKMDCQPNLHLPPLGPEETAKLFAAIAGDEFGDPKTDTLAAKLVKICEGLPILILPLARMLKNKALSTLEEAVEHIKKSEAVYSTLELSYQSLEEEKYKELFLLCGLMGNQNIPVRNLLKHSIGLGSFDGTNVVERARREMVESLRKLKASSLLLQGDDNDHVRIHDVVREFSTKIANKNDRHLVCSDDKDLQVCPAESLEKITTISLPRREMVESLRIQASSLLLQGDDNDHVKIHDVFREFSTKLANKDGRHLVFSDDKDLQVGPAKSPEEITTISLPHVAIQTLRQHVSNYPNLTTFISHAGDYTNAQGDDFNAQNSISKGNRFEVPDSFFEGMRKLRVLDIRSANFTSLPSSVHLLQNLTTLCLDNCVIEDISIIGKLKGLQVLSFMGSEIEHLPKEVGELTNLVLLDLSKCSKLKVIEQGVMERLTKLEDLYLEESFDQWEGEGDAAQVNARLAELNNMPWLRTLDVRVSNPKLLHQDLPFGKLERHRILVGGKWDWSGSYEELRTMKLEVVRSDVLSQQWLQLNLQKVQDLHLYGISEGTCLSVHALCVEGFMQLKHLRVESSTAFQYIVSSAKWLAHDAFTRLESLLVKHLDNLEKICHGLVTPLSFGRLKVIKVERCGKLKNMFSLSLMESLSQLEEIDVYDCKMMQAVVLDESKDDDDEEKVASGCWECYSTTKSLFCGPRIAGPELPQESDQISRTKRIPALFTKRTEGGYKGKRVVELANLRRLTLRFLPEITTFFTRANPQKPQEIARDIFVDGQQVWLPKLQSLKIYELPKLKELLSRSETEPSMGLTMSNLQSLEVRYCDQLSKVFDSNLLMELRSLESLEITNCDMLTEVFNLEGINTKRGSNDGILPQLCKIMLFLLPKLSCIWSKCPRGEVAAFQNLRELKVSRCDELRYLFTPSMAKATAKLTELDVERCDKMEAIIMDEDHGKMESASSCNIKEFPSLKVLLIFECCKLKEFYSIKGDSNPTFRFPLCCGEKERDHHQVAVNSTKTVFFNRMVLLPRLMEMTLCLVGDFEKIWDNNELPETETSSNFSKLETISVGGCKKLRTVFPLTSTEKRWQNLKEVDIGPCEFLESVFEVDVNGREHSDKKEKRTAAIMLPELQKLDLFWLPKLKCVVFDEKVSKTKTVVGFPNLTGITVVGCDCLTDLIPLTTATTLLKLETLKIKGCKGMREVVSRRDGKADQMDEIIIPRLRSLELSSLESLEYFFYGSSPPFRFPSLKDLEITGCSEMKGFIAEPPNGGPQLQDDDVASQGLFNEKVFLPNLEKLQIIGIKLRALWKKQLSPGTFCKLKHLKVERCTELLSIVPSFMRKRLRNLECLKVDDCSSSECIYEGLDAGDSSTSARMNRQTYPEDEAYLEKLQGLHVFDCLKLRYIIGSRDGKCIHVAPGIVILPKLTTLELKKLPALCKFWQGSLCTLELPSLNKWLVRECGSLEEAVSDAVDILPQDLDDQIDVVIQQKRLPAAIPDLPILDSTDWNDELIEHILSVRQSHLEVLHGVRFLAVEKFVVRSAIYASSLVFKLKLEELILADASLEVLFTCEVAPSALVNKDNPRNVVAAPLRRLKLVRCPELFNIWKGDEFTFSKHLETLRVSECAKLISLLPPLTTFQNLTSLEVSKCHRLKALLTVSTVKSLPKLAEISVVECDALTEIVACGESGDSDVQEEIAFSRLEVLELDCLMSIKHFCSGSHGLKLPWLTKLTMVGCPEMKIFCQGDISTPKLQDIELRDRWNRAESYKLYSDLNTTMKKLFSEKTLLSSMHSLKISESIEWKEIWLGTGSLPSGTFGALRSLTIEDCGFLTVAAVPSHISLLFQWLEKLEIRNCGAVQEVFEPPRADDAKVYFSLLELHLRDLLKLRLIFPKDFHRTFSFEQLNTLQVHNCSCLLNILTPNMVPHLESLRKIKIKDCTMLEEIITKEKEDEEILESKIWFPNLQDIVIHGLAALKSFYPGDCRLEFPSLEKMTIKNCPEMVRFAHPTASIREDDDVSNTRDVIDQEIASQPAFFSEKVLFPDLKELTLSGLGNLSTIWHNEFSGDSFRRLEEINIESCGMLRKVFPPITVQRCMCLKTLIVAECDSLEVVFDLVGLAAMVDNGDEIHEDNEQGEASRVASLGKLEISRLPKLRSLWNVDKEGFVSFENLKEVHVRECPKLVNLFPVSIARGLTRLESLNIEECGLEWIVAKGEEAIRRFVFLEATFLKLWRLPKLEGFYPRVHTSEWPMLKQMVVHGCNKVEVFASGCGCLHQTSAEGREFAVKPPLFSVDKDAFPNLLSLSIEAMAEIWPHQFSREIFPKLKNLKINNSKDLAADLPAYRLQNLCKLVLSKCHFKDIESHEGSPVKGITGQHVHQVPNNGALPHLGVLQVSECSGLANLDQLPLSFQSLMVLKVSACHELLCLMSSAKAKSLIRLTHMTIENCRVMEEVVANEGYVETNDEITFEQLQKLTLSSLSELSSFSRGNFNVKFPSLWKVSLSECPKMELFFHGTLSTPMLEIFQISGKAIFLHDHNLNAAMLERSQATGGQLKRQSEVEQHHENSWAGTSSDSELSSLM